MALQRQGAPWAPLRLRLRLTGPEATPPSPPTGPAQSLLCPMITASCVLQPCLQTCVFLPGTALHLLRELSVPRRRQWAPTPVLLPGKSHGRRSLVGCSPWGRKESGTTEQLTLNTYLIYKLLTNCLIFVKCNLLSYQQRVAFCLCCVWQMGNLIYTGSHT